ncbi:unnamed protein product [Coccothraustes coccothraustes]
MLSAEPAGAATPSGRPRGQRNRAEPAPGVARRRTPNLQTASGGGHRGAEPWRADGPRSEACTSSSATRPPSSERSSAGARLSRGCGQEQPLTHGLTLGLANQTEAFVSCRLQLRASRSRKQRWGKLCHGHERYRWCR